MRINPYLMLRKAKGRFVKDFQDLQLHRQYFIENFHMEEHTFRSIHTLVEPFLRPGRNTRPKDFISLEEKLACVLEYLASGSLQRYIASVYRISKQYMGKIIEEVCDALTIALKENIPVMEKEGFLETANCFNYRCQFPNCIGAIDGKHVAIRAPNSSGSLFFNYKGFHSLLLMAICDASYKFTYLDIGAYGSEGDASVFVTSDFGKDVINDNLPFPEDASIFKM